MFSIGDGNGCRGVGVGYDVLESMMHKVSTVVEGPEGNRYLGTDAFMARQAWCQEHCQGQWDAFMGYFAFAIVSEAEAFRKAFGHS